MALLDKLLLYQGADTAHDACENELKGSSNYKRFVKVRSYLEEQKRVLSRMSAAADTRYKQIAQTMANIDMLEEKYNDGKVKLETIDKESLGDIERFRKYFEQINQLIANERREFTELCASIESDDSQLSDMRNKLGKARKEFDELKVKVDEERKEKEAQLASLKEQMQTLAADVSPELIAKYNEIKKFHAVPIATVADKRCCGCSMELPTVAFSKLREDTEPVECDNCSRLLYCPPAN